MEYKRREDKQENNLSGLGKIVVGAITGAGILLSTGCTIELERPKRQKSLMEYQNFSEYFDLEREDYLDSEGNLKKKIHVEKDGKNYLIERWKESEDGETFYKIYRIEEKEED